MTKCVITRLAIVISFVASAQQTIRCEGADPTYCIFGPSIEWPNVGSVEFQLYVGGSAYFGSVGRRVKHPDDKVIPHPFTNSGDYVFTFPLDPTASPTYIRTRSTKGCLSVNYMTDPPCIIEREEPDGTSKWVLISDENKDEWYIQNLDRRGEGLWLTMDKEPVVRPIRDTGLVLEFRKAVLSRTKTPMRVSERPISK